MGLRLQARDDSYELLWGAPRRRTEKRDFGLDHVMNDQRPRATRTTTAAPTISGGPVVAADVDAWKIAVDEQERQCAAHRFGAAVVSIALTTPSVEQRRGALAVLAAEMASTDVIGILSETELGLVLMPLESVLVGQQRVHRIDDALRAGGIVAAIGWAMRQDGHGLFHASARADAALASALRQRGVDLR